MIKQLLFLFIILLSSQSYSAGMMNNGNIYLTVDFETKSISIPLKKLNHKTVRPPSNPNNPFIIVDGIYCSSNGNYLEGLCSFKDTNGDDWQIKFSSEVLSNRKYSIFSVIVIRGNIVQQQNDFSFKGNPIDILDMKVAPFSIIGLQTKKNEWFSVTLNVQ